MPDVAIQKQALTQRQGNRVNSHQVGQVVKEAKGVPAGLSNRLSEQPARQFESLCLFYRDWLFMDDVSGVSFTRSAYVDWQMAVIRALGLLESSQHSEAGSYGSQAQSLDNAGQQGSQLQVQNELPIRRLRWPPTEDMDKRLALSNKQGARDQRVYSASSLTAFIVGWLERQRALLGRPIRCVVLQGRIPQTLADPKWSSNENAHADRDALNHHVQGSMSSPDLAANAGDNASQLRFELKSASGAIAQLFPEAKVLSAPPSPQLWRSAEAKKNYWLQLQALRASM